MLADFYIPRLSNNMKIAVQKNNLWGQILYRSLDPVKKNGVKPTQHKTGQPDPYFQTKNN